MDAIGTWIRRAENLVSFSALAMLTGSVLWGVLTRYVTERPAVWTTELSGILFTWVVFIGAMTAMRDNRHIRVTLLIDTLPGMVRRTIHKIGEAVVLAFLVYVTYLSVLMMQEGATRPSPVLDIPFSYVYLASVICFAGMSVTSLFRLLGLAKPTEPGAQEDVA